MYDSVHLCMRVHKHVRICTRYVYVMRYMKCVICAMYYVLCIL